MDPMQRLEGKGALRRRDFLKILAGTAGMAAVSGFAAPLPTAGTPGEHRPPSFIILVFDALSARNMSLYGYPRGTTPNIDRFSERAVVYHRNYAAGNFTTPGTASILTGTYPWSHRALHTFGGILQEFASRNMFAASSGLTRVAFSHNDLATLLLNQFHAELEMLVKPADLSLFYEKILPDGPFRADHNAAFLAERAMLRGQTGHRLPSNLLLSILQAVWLEQSRSALEGEFGEEFPRGLPREPGYRAIFLLEEAIDWIRDFVNQASQPFLAYFHLYPPHRPYSPRAEFVGRFDGGWEPPQKPNHFFSEGHTPQELAQLRREYDEYVAYADSEFGRLMSELDRSGNMQQTYLILTSDHGEMFERGIYEHITETLFEPILHVPLIISRPGKEARLDVHVPTSSVDLLPSLLRILGREIPAWCEGIALPGLVGEAGDGQRVIFAVEAKTNPARAPLRTCTIAMIKGTYKLTYYRGYEGYSEQFELYDVVADPEELNNIYDPDRSLCAGLRDELLGRLEQANEAFR
jgi:arylsulfatase A-like enzyme